ncbi:MAG: hypothetical protein KAH14_03990 [Clostridiales bacterium]|nr:hypothetical protein [Clostridiales bacterium]
MTQEHQKGKFRFFISGFIMLSAMVLILYAVTFTNSIRTNIPSMIILLLTFLFIAYTLINEAFIVRTLKTDENILNMENLMIFAAVFLGAVITYALSIYAGLGAVLASGIVGVAVAVLYKKYAAPAFCGSFVGMSSTLLLNQWELIIAAVLAGIIYILAKNVLNGFGGKFGTIAFISCLLAAYITGNWMPAKNFAGWDVGLLLVFVSISAAVLTYVLSIRLKLGPVLASALIGVMAGLWLPLIFPDYGVTMAVMAFCASFVGMSNPKRIKNEFFVAIAGLISGFAFIFSFTLQGAGGKLGTIAFGSVMAVYGISKIFMKISGVKNSKPLKTS